MPTAAPGRIATLRNTTQRHCRWLFLLIAVLIQFGPLLLACMCAYADDADDQDVIGQRKSYIDILACGGLKITVFSDYIEQESGFKYFTRQRATAEVGGKSKVFLLDNNEAHVKANKYGYQRFGVLSAYQCVTSISGSRYIYLLYDVDGNCNECEWADIIDERGELIASEKEGGQGTFDRISLELGISEDSLEKWNWLNRP